MMLGEEPIIRNESKGQCKPKLVGGDSTYHLFTGFSMAMLNNQRVDMVFLWEYGIRFYLVGGDLTILKNHGVRQWKG